ncbi:MAG: glycyl-radical enzyme activating protein [Candidatus Coatesbacteria bacterium]|nr:glycyl-radical enzyme activating protein [Candidatus Coatesbacteria bacterium]
MRTAMANGIITELKRFATHDGPGIRTSVFLKGCPLRCGWCSNPETLDSGPQLYFIASRCRECGACVEACPEGAVSMDSEGRIDREKCSLCLSCVDSCVYGALRTIGEQMTSEQLMMEVEKDRPFYGEDGGLTLTGGEPLFQPEFCNAMLKACRDRGISTVLDTSGYAPPEVVEEMMRYTDLVLLDIKHLDPKKHREGTGVDNRLVLENAALMASMTTVRISLPLVGGFNSTEEEVRAIAEMAASLGIEHIDVNPMHCLGRDKYRYLGLTPPPEKYNTPTKVELKRAVAVIEKLGLKTTIGRMM